MKVKWHLTFSIANATLLHDPPFLKEHMFNKCPYLRRLVLFCVCQTSFLTQLDSSFNGGENKFTKVFSFKIGIFSLVVKCMQKAYDYGIYVSIKVSSASQGSVAYYFPAIQIYSSTVLILFQLYLRTMHSWRQMIAW